LGIIPDCDVIVGAPILPPSHPKNRLYGWTMSEDGRPARKPSSSTKGIRYSNNNNILHCTMATTSTTKADQQGGAATSTASGGAPAAAASSRTARTSPPVPSHSAADAVESSAEEEEEEEQTPSAVGTEVDDTATDASASEARRKEEGDGGGGATATTRRQPSSENDTADEGGEEYFNDFNDDDSSSLLADLGLGNSFDGGPHVDAASSQRRFEWVLPPPRVVSEEEQQQKGKPLQEQDSTEPEEGRKQRSKESRETEKAACEINADEKPDRRGGRNRRTVQVVVESILSGDGDDKDKNIDSPPSPPSSPGSGVRARSGHKLWPGAELLVDYIVNNTSSNGNDKVVSVVELGAGCGLASLAALQVWQRTVQCIAVTDRDITALERARFNYESTLENILNASQNEEELNETINDLASIPVFFQKLTWGNEADERRVLELFEEHVNVTVEDEAAATRADTILGSDLIDDASAVEPLFRTVSRLLKKSKKEKTTMPTASAESSSPPSPGTRHSAEDEECGDSKTDGADSRSRSELAGDVDGDVDDGGGRFWLAQSFAYDDETEAAIDAACSALGLARTTLLRPVFGVSRDEEATSPSSSSSPPPERRIQEFRHQSN